MPAWPFLLAAALFCLVAVVFWRRTGAHVGLLLGCCALGFGLSTLGARAVVPDGLSDGGLARLEGVAEELRTSAEQTRLVLAVSRVTLGPHPAVAARFRAVLYAQGPLPGPEWHPGQRVVLSARLKPVEPASNPGERDASGLRHRRAVRFTGSFRPDALVPLSAAPSWRLWLSAEHQRLAKAVKAAAPSAESAALYLTLAAGLRAGLGEELEEEFAASGLAHVLSVSGLHVAALALALLYVLRRLAVLPWRRARRFDMRRVAAPVAIPLVWAYVAYTGWQPPAVRSALMGSVLLAGMALWRRSDPLNSLCLSAMVILVWDPGSIGDLSLQLSFTAVGSLVLLSPAVGQALPKSPEHPRGWLSRLAGRSWEQIRQTSAASVAVTLAGVPLVAAAFHRLSLAGLLSNVVALPLCGALTGLAAGGAALHTLSPALALPVLWLGTRAAAALVMMAEVFARLPIASVPVSGMGPGLTGVFFAGLAAFAVGEGKLRWAGLSSVAVFAWALTPWAVPRPGLTVTFLAVGHGDAVVISSGGQHALVDGGGVPGGGNPGERIVLPFLREQRIRRLELAVLSHPHPDHALGLISTLESLPTRTLWLPAGSADGELSFLAASAARAHGAEVKEVEAGEPALWVGEARLEVLGPPRDRVLLEGVNDRSVVLRIVHGDVTVLLPGDIEEAGEEALDPGPVTVLKAPHHGSKTSSTPGFLARVRPQFVVFCVGRRNRFHFPNDDVEARYRALGAQCHRTDLDGAVTVTSDGRTVQVQTFHFPALLPAAPVAAVGAD